MKTNYARALCATLVLERGARCEQCGVGLYPWYSEDILLLESVKKQIEEIHRKIPSAAKDFPILNRVLIKGKPYIEMYVSMLKGGVAHHINGNRKENDLSNLLLFCSSCHALTHIAIRRVRTSEYDPDGWVTVNLTNRIKTELYILKIAWNLGSLNEVVDRLLISHRPEKIKALGIHLPDEIVVPEEGKQ